MDMHWVELAPLWNDTNRYGIRRGTCQIVVNFVTLPRDQQNSQDDGQYLKVGSGGGRPCFQGGLDRRLGMSKRGDWGKLC